MEDKSYGSVDSSLLEGLNERQKQSVLSWEAYTQFNQAMGDILGNMKEIPVLPSDIPPENDRHTLTKVELPSEGGVLTFMSDQGYPYRGFPYAELVEKIDTMKKLVRGSLSGFFQNFRKNKLSVIPMVLAFRGLLSASVYSFYRIVERYRIKPLRYSQAIRELYRAFSFPQDDTDLKGFRYQMRDLVCMVLEFDNAYRFRAQSLLVEIDKDSLRKNPAKELSRLVKIASGREKEQQVIDTWKLIKLFIVYLRFDAKLTKMIVEVLSQIDMEKFKLTPEDVHYFKQRKDYVFGS